MSGNKVQTSQLSLLLTFGDRAPLAKEVSLSLSANDTCMSQKKGKRLGSSFSFDNLRPGFRCFGFRGSYEQPPSLPPANGIASLAGQP